MKEKKFIGLVINRLTKAFKTKHPHLKITTVKEYMGAMFFEKNFEKTKQEVYLKPK